jgi:hypothetical protein
MSHSDQRSGRNPLVLKTPQAGSLNDLKNSEKSIGSVISIIDPSQDIDLGQPFGRGAGVPIAPDFVVESIADGELRTVELQARFGVIGHRRLARVSR